MCDFYLDGERVDTSRHPRKILILAQKVPCVTIDIVSVIAVSKIGV